MWQRLEACVDEVDLIEKIRQHRDQYHPEISDAQIREMVTARAYEEEEARVA